jgi:hypothetical protein
MIKYKKSIKKLKHKNFILLNIHKQFFISKTNCNVIFLLIKNKYLVIYLSKF